jgi:hypothetical protein
MVALPGEMRMNARLATKVVVRTTIPRSEAQQAPHFAAAQRDGAWRAVYFVARLAQAPGLRCASLRVFHPAKPRRGHARVSQSFPSARVRERTPATTTKEPD